MVTQTGTDRRSFTREKRYTRTLSLTLTPAQLEAVTLEADRRDTSLTAVVRECIDRGLPLVRDAGRKRRARGEPASA